ncbi:oligoendopeptidase F [Spirochaetia bacterium]|nr:oligoendopeptidase F [Spirochaetia bacterium]
MTVPDYDDPMNSFDISRRFFGSRSSDSANGAPSVAAGNTPGALPRWKLGTIYPSFDSAEYKRDLALLGERLAAFLVLLGKPLPADPAQLAPALKTLIAAWEEAGDLSENLSAYTEAVYTTDTRDSRALAEINAIDAANLPLGKAAVLFRSRLAEQGAPVLKLALENPEIMPYRFFITESLEKAAFQMSCEEEDLANDLLRSGGDAWSRLHEAVSSTATAVLEDEKGKSGERKTVIALRDLARRADRFLRQRAYRAELSAWKGVEIPMAASLNGVKGTAITLDTRRGWGKADGGSLSAEAMRPSGSLSDRQDSGVSIRRPDVMALRKSAFQSRMSLKTLETLIAALESALPLYRRYLKTKAALLGVPVCAFYDLFAPVSAGPADEGRRTPSGAAGNAADSGAAGHKVWTWEDAMAFIPERFDGFDPGMGTFARHAFSLGWIDAEGREGKVGGAYCTDFPLSGESRILCNFDGSFDSITTVAHELGHAWHHELIKDLPRALSRYPMTLAETASIFAETIVFEGALKQSPKNEQLPLIEENLKDSCQVIVDILSRFYFEKALFKRRAEAELSPEELCDLMLDAQRRTYGDGLDGKQLHPYMWAVKGHYYSTGLAFYNYPYAFGQLFALGLYSRAQKEGPDFAAAYREILRATGQASAEDVARKAGFNIEEEAFWQDGLAVIAGRVDELEKLAAG